MEEGSDKKNILILALGSGFCINKGTDVHSCLHECAHLTKSWEGSSKFLPPSYMFNLESFGIGDKNQISNKFANWTKVVLLNCDGTFFQGYNKDPVEHEGQKLYFRGSVIMRAHFKWIDEKFGLEQAEKIVFAGSSIGGIGVILWIDYLKGLVTKPEKVYGIVDSASCLEP